jgi:hypothetical protein
VPVVLFALLVAAGVLIAYHAGKRTERKQVWKWLRFLHSETGLRDVSPHRLAAAISVGQHYDLDER